MVSTVEVSVLPDDERGKGETLLTDPIVFEFLVVSVIIVLLLTVECCEVMLLLVGKLVVIVECCEVMLLLVGELGVKVNEPDPRMLGVVETEAIENLEDMVVGSTELVLGKGTGIRRRKAVLGVS